MGWPPGAAPDGIADRPPAIVVSLPEIFRRCRWHRYETDAARHWEVVWEDHWRGKAYAALLEEARSSGQARFLREHLSAAGLGAFHHDTEFGLVRDSALLPALRRMLPRVFRMLHGSLRAVSTRVTAHMPMHRAGFDCASEKSG